MLALLSTTAQSPNSCKHKMEKHIGFPLSHGCWLKPTMNATLRERSKSTTSLKLQDIYTHHSPPYYSHFPSYHIMHHLPALQVWNGTSNGATECIIYLPDKIFPSLNWEQLHMLNINSTRFSTVLLVGPDIATTIGWVSINPALTFMVSRGWILQILGILTLEQTFIPLQSVIIYMFTFTKAACFVWTCSK